MYVCVCVCRLVRDRTVQGSIVSSKHPVIWRNRSMRKAKERRMGTDRLSGRSAYMQVYMWESIFVFYLCSWVIESTSNRGSSQWSLRIILKDRTLFLERQDAFESLKSIFWMLWAPQMKFSALPLYLKTWAHKNRNYMHGEVSLKMFFMTGANSPFKVTYSIRDRPMWTPGKKKSTRCICYDRGLFSGEKTCKTSPQEASLWVVMNTTSHASTGSHE